MSLVRGQRKVLPLSLIRSRDRLEGLQCKCRNRLDEVTSTHTVVVRPGSVTDKGCNLSHGLDANDALQREVCRVASSLVRRNPNNPLVSEI